MGYHVSITRERRGSKSDIPLEDWLSFARASPELELVTPKGSDKASEFLRSIHAARWKGTEDAWLAWSDGEIWAKNPPDELARYMVGIAPQFGARVRDDDGGYFRALNDKYYEEEDGREISWQERQQTLKAEFAHTRRKRFYVDLVRIFILLVVAYLLIRKHFFA